MSYDYDGIRAAAGRWVGGPSATDRRPAPVMGVDREGGLHDPRSPGCRYAGEAASYSFTCPTCDPAQPDGLIRLRELETELEKIQHAERELADKARKGLRLQREATQERRTLRIAREQAQARLADLKRPPEPAPDRESPATVITFRKRWPGGVYDYAAIRVGAAPRGGEWRSRRWSITQSSAAQRPQPMMNWHELTEFIGEEYWSSIVERVPTGTVTETLVEDAVFATDSTGYES